MNVTLITDEYRALQAQLHAGGSYGTTAFYYGRVVDAFLARLNVNSLLDYGCGSKRSLLKGLNLPGNIVYEGYDPCVPEYSAPPCPAELVVCIDVLEHIEPELLDNVLDHLAELCDPYGVFTVHTGPAAKSLADGRNAHLIQRAPNWWLSRFGQRFLILEQQPVAGGFLVLVRSRRN